MPPTIESLGSTVPNQRRPPNNGGIATTKPQGNNNAGDFDRPRVMPLTLFQGGLRRVHSISTSPITNYVSVGGAAIVPSRKPWFNIQRRCPKVPTKTTNYLKLKHHHKGLNSSYGLKANSLMNFTQVPLSIKQQLTARLKSSISEEPDVEEELTKRRSKVRKVLGSNLTKNYLIETFPDLPFKKVVEYFNRHFPKPRFTAGEKKLLQSFIKRDGLNSSMGNDVFDHFPTRSKKFICIMYGRLQSHKLNQFLRSSSTMVSLSMKVPRRSQPIEEDDTNEFAPEDIMTDTRVPLHGRDFFMQEILANQDLPEYPKYPEPGCGFDSRCPVGTDVSRIDDLAVKTCKNSPKCYKLLPEKFSQSFGKSEMKFSPEIKLRHLLFPAHCASYTICNPISGHFNPVSQIRFFWQITWAVYFPFLARLQSIIFQLQNDLADAWRNHDAAEILFLVDKWNLLMLFISPNRQVVNNIVKNNEIDINQIWREQLSGNGVTIKSVSFKDLALDIWVDEIMEEAVPRNFTMTNGQVGPSQFLLPSNFYVRSRQILREQQTLLRFVVHTLMDCAYARFASPKLSMLKKYKIGTSEVYGELTHSFISEVCKQLRIKPGQLFYDLGMALGLVCQQMSLEFGVKSGGCEVRKDLTDITMAIDRWLIDQLLMLGIQPPQITWTHGQLFVDNKQVETELKECDLVLVTNLKFDPSTNEGVGRLLTCLRDGCKIISFNMIYSKTDLENLVFSQITLEPYDGDDYLVSWCGSTQTLLIQTVHREN